MPKELTVSYCYETKKFVEQIEQSFIILAERLYNIYHKNLWQGEWESWDEFVSECKMSKGTASKLISVYGTYVLTYGMKHEQLAPAGWSGLYELLPTVSNTESAQDAVVKATTLRREEIREEVREHKHGKCDHPDEAEVHFYQCRNCGHRRPAQIVY